MILKYVFVLNLAATIYSTATAKTAGQAWFRGTTGLFGLFVTGFAIQRLGSSGVLGGRIMGREYLNRFFQFLQNRFGASAGESSPLYPLIEARPIPDKPHGRFTIIRDRSTGQIIRREFAWRKTLLIWKWFTNMRILLTRSGLVPSNMRFSHPTYGNKKPSI